MTPIPEPFQGHDLTGWTVVNDTTIARFAKHGLKLGIKKDGFSYRTTDASSPVDYLHTTLSRALAHTEKQSKKCGGWAPAPIGYELSGWQPIETLPDRYKDSEETFFGFAPVAEKLHVRGVMHFDQRENAFVIVNFGAAWDTICKPTHWRPMPEPPQEGKG